MSDELAELQPNSEINIVLQNEKTNTTTQLKYSIKAALSKGNNTCRCYIANDIVNNSDVVIKQYGKNVKKEQLVKDCEFMESNNSQVIAKGFAHFMYNNVFTVVMKYYQNGTLFQYYEGINTGKHQAPTLDRKNQWCRRIVASVAQLHGFNQVHRNISPSNIFVSDDEQNLILSDFGLVIEEPDTKDIKKKQKIGSRKIETIAPEVLKEQPFTKASDMWSVGCVLYFIINESLPFFDKDENELLEKILQANYQPSSHSHTLNIDRIINKLLILDPKQRTTSDAIIQAGQLIKPLTIPVYVGKMQQNFLVHTIDKIRDLKEKIAAIYPLYTVDKSKICFCTADGTAIEEDELANDETIFEFLAKKMEKSLNIECEIILDKSGSMNDKEIIKKLQTSYKAFIKSMQEFKQNIFITLVEFSDVERTNSVYRHEPVQNISATQDLYYKPFGDTALIDTITSEITQMSDYIGKGNKVDLVAFFIITDGVDDMYSEDIDEAHRKEENLKNLISNATQLGWVFDLTGPLKPEEIQQKYGILNQNVTMAANGKDATAAFTQIKRKILEVMQKSSNLGVILKQIVIQDFIQKASLQQPVNYKEIRIHKREDTLLSVEQLKITYCNYCPSTFVMTPAWKTAKNVINYLSDIFAMCQERAKQQFFVSQELEVNKVMTYVNQQLSVDFDANAIQQSKALFSIWWLNMELWSPLDKLELSFLEMKQIMQNRDNADRITGIQADQVVDGFSYEVTKYALIDKENNNQILEKCTILKKKQ